MLQWYIIYVLADTLYIVYKCSHNYWWGHDTHAYDDVWRMGWRGRRPARVSKSRRCCSTLADSGRWRGGWWGHDTHAYDYVWHMGWRGRRPARVSKARRRPEAISVRVPEVEAQSNSSSSLSRNLGPVCLKLVTQDTSGLRFRWSTYEWKTNLIRKPIQVVLH